MKLGWFAVFMGITMFNLLLAYSVFVTNANTRQIAYRAVERLHECQQPGTTIRGHRDADKDHT